jgi:hypothetical protein
VRLASAAAVPEEPVSPRKLLNTVVAGALGGIVAVIGVFISGWWHAGRADQEDEDGTTISPEGATEESMALADISRD